MEAIDYRYEEFLDRLAERRRFEQEEQLPVQEHTVYDVIGECEECGETIFNDSTEHFYSHKLDIFLCESCISSRWGDKPKSAVI